MISCESIAKSNKWFLILSGLKFVLLCGTHNFFSTFKMLVLLWNISNLKKNNPNFMPYLSESSTHWNQI